MSRASRWGSSCTRIWVGETGGDARFGVDLVATAFDEALATAPRTQANAGHASGETVVWDEMSLAAASLREQRERSPRCVDKARARVSYFLVRNMTRPRQITDEQIDDASRATFLEHGHAAPVALVAAKLGVSHAALLQRAGSKDALLLRALALRPELADEKGASAARGPNQRLAHTLLALGEAPPTRARSARLITLLVELHAALGEILPGLLVLRSRGLPTGPPPGVEAPTVHLRRLLAQWLERTSVVKPKRASALAEAFLGAIEAHCFNAHLGGPSFVGEAPHPLAARLVTVLVPELGAAPRSQSVTTPPKTTQHKRKS